jgi:hypothetical protein
MKKIFLQLSLVAIFVLAALGSAVAQVVSWRKPGFMIRGTPESLSHSANPAPEFPTLAIRITVCT